MVSRCLNPACKTPLLYLRDGRLFSVQKTPSSSMVEHFWLCGDCAKQFDVQISESGVPVIVPREEQEQFPQSRSGKGMLLCIDDNAIALEMLKTILERNGYAVIAAACGSQGLTVLIDYEIDVVILDWEMPEMNGRETASEIKRMNPEMPIIINSGSLEIPEDIFTVADAFVPKGIECKVLLAAITDLISGRRDMKAPSRRRVMDPRRSNRNTN